MFCLEILPDSFSLFSKLFLKSPFQVLSGPFVPKFCLFCFFFVVFCSEIMSCFPGNGKSKPKGFGFRNQSQLNIFVHGFDFSRPEEVVDTAQNSVHRDLFKHWEMIWRSSATKRLSRMIFFRAPQSVILLAQSLDATALSSSGCSSACVPVSLE